MRALRIGVVGQLGFAVDPDVLELVPGQVVRALDGLPNDVLRTLVEVVLIVVVTELRPHLLRVLGIELALELVEGGERGGLIPHPTELLVELPGFPQVGSGVVTVCGGEEGKVVTLGHL